MIKNQYNTDNIKKLFENNSNKKYADIKPIKTSS